MANLENNKFDKIGALKDIQRPYLFELIIKDPVGISTNDSDISIRCHKASIPGRGAEIIEANFYGLKVHYAGRPTYGSNQLTVEFLEHEDQTIIQYLYDWNELVYGTRSGTGGTEKSYKTDITLRMYSNSQAELSKYISFKNAFIESISDADLVHAAASEGVKYSVVFRYDYWELV